MKKRDTTEEREQRNVKVQLNYKMLTIAHKNGFQFPFG